jgi:hypothetical protein
MTWQPDICVYHGNCTDGFGAAWAVWRRWNSVRFVPAVYGEPIVWPESLARKHILFVDFSLKRQAMIDLAHAPGGAPKTITVLDHHKTAWAELQDWACDVVPADDSIPLLANKACCETGVPLVAVFDMDKSGARLAWEFCHPGYEVPQLVSYIEDRDLWRFKLPLTETVIAALRTYPQEFEVWSGLAWSIDRLLQEGIPILRAHRLNVHIMCEQEYAQEVAGFTVPVCNVPGHYASDVAHELLQRHPEAAFAAAWFRRADGKRQYSLRSQDNRQDVSEIAKVFGGGGHRNAAGFEIADQPFSPTMSLT